MTFQHAEGSICYLQAHLGEGKSKHLPSVREDTQFHISVLVNRAESERLAAERLLEEAKALIEDAKIRVDKDETEVDEKLQLRVGQKATKINKIVLKMLIFERSPIWVEEKEWLSVRSKSAKVTAMTN